MGARRKLEELDWQTTPMGEISLRRRVEPSSSVDVYEVKLGDEFLMSSLFTVAEIALADLALERVDDADGLDVVVGGLGLGCTARAALADPRVRTLTVVEALAEVISWHERDLVPGGAELTGDPRCRLLHGDFFAMVGAGRDGWSGLPDPCHAILLDVDHTPTHLLHPSHAGFYVEAGLRRVVERLRPGGVLGVWSDAPDAAFAGRLAEVFADVQAHTVTFANPLTGGESSNAVYVATVSR